MTVNISGLLESIEELDNIHTTLFYEIDRLKEVESALARMPVCSDIAFALRQQIENTTLSREHMGELLQVLDTACRYFQICSERIVDALEGSALQRRAFTAQFADLEGISRTLINYI